MQEKSGKPHGGSLDVEKKDMHLISGTEEDTLDRLRWIKGKQVICCGAVKRKKQKDKIFSPFSMYQSLLLHKHILHFALLNVTFNTFNASLEVENLRKGN